MSTPSLTLAILLAAGLSLAVPLSAEAGGPPGAAYNCLGPQAAQGHRDGVPPMMKGLKLTAEQQARIAELRKQDADLMDEKFKHFRDTRMQLDEMQMKGEYDELQVKKLTEEGAQVMAELEQIRARQQHQMMDILTPAQRKEFEAQSQRLMQRRLEQRVRQSAG